MILSNRWWREQTQKWRCRIRMCAPTEYVSTSIARITQKNNRSPEIVYRIKLRCPDCGRPVTRYAWLK